LNARRLRIVIPGGSGQLGQILAGHFQLQGHQVTVLTRGPYTAPWQTVHWDGVTIGPWTEQLEGADVCINLAGRSVNCRYHHANRESIYHSRIDTTHLLNQVIANLADPPKIWLNASTATIYRHALDRPMDELTGESGGNEPGAPAKWNFSIDVAKAWEAAFFAAPTPRTRKVAMRSAVVFSPIAGNPFVIYSNLVRLGLGGTQGSGRQYISWIHDLDFARAVEFLIARDDLEGAINLASPYPLPNREFMAILREAWDMPNGLPAPAPLLELAAFLHRTETELLLKSWRVIPTRLLEAGFDLEYENWPAAAADLVHRWRHRFD
jgi:uncharacterized protein